jgi:phosphatidylinositol glycan class M
MPAMAFSLWTPTNVFLAAILLRVVLLLYGLVQDAYSPLKYTDIDYFVFTDAARYVARGLSPYHRETYRYTPLLAWILLPTSWPGTAWFSFGKVLFSVADIIAGWLLVLILRSGAGGSMPMERSLKFSSIWLLNPMVATISTRGSSEGLLGVMVTALLWAIINDRIALGGFLLGLSVHFKIYPFIYAPALVLYLATPATTTNGFSTAGFVKSLVNSRTVTLTTISLLTFMGLNVAMYAMYGQPFLQHTYLHHVTRIDHRHNFSVYNTLLYASSAAVAGVSSPISASSLTAKLESLAFLPQLLLSAFLLPLALARSNLPGSMLAQTWAFVALNKVCTSQYFLWYLALLPLYLPHSSFLERPRFGLAALGAWIAAQVLWLQQGFQLEFNGNSTFVPGLWVAGLAFYAANMWILGVIVGDVGAMEVNEVPSQLESEVKTSTESGKPIAESG